VNAPNFHPDYMPNAGLNMPNRGSGTDAFLHEARSIADRFHREMSALLVSSLSYTSVFLVTGLHDLGPDTQLVAQPDCQGRGREQHPIRVCETRNRRGKTCVIRPGKSLGA
jgi:hypothetical protein